jgi:Adenylate cyclase associated (CAP) C terminal.
MSWVASGMSMLPGLAPRPQHHIVKRNDFSEQFTSTSNAMFISVRECENAKLEVTGKTGKVSLERSTGVDVTLDNRVVGGVLEVIKCNNVLIKLRGEAEVGSLIF